MIDYRIKNMTKQYRTVELGTRSLHLVGRGSDESKAPDFRWPTISEEEYRGQTIQGLILGGKIVVEPIGVPIKLRLTKELPKANEETKEESPPRVLSLKKKSGETVIKPKKKKLKGGKFNG